MSVVDFSPVVCVFHVQDISLRYSLIPCERERELQSMLNIDLSNKMKVIIDEDEKKSAMSFLTLPDQ